MTCTFIRTSGRMSLASTPSLRATSIVSTFALRPTITCFTRGSAARSSVSMRRSASTFSALPSASTGSSAGYSTGARTGASASGAWLRPSRAIARAEPAAASSAFASMSSE